MDFKLKPHPTIPKPSGPLLVCILDGVRRGRRSTRSRHSSSKGQHGGRRSSWPGGAALF